MKTSRVEENAGARTRPRVNTQTPPVPVPPPPMPPLVQPGGRGIPGIPHAQIGNAGLPMFGFLPAPVTGGAGRPAQIPQQTSVPNLVIPQRLPVPSVPTIPLDILSILAPRVPVNHGAMSLVQETPVGLAAHPIQMQTAGLDTSKPGKADRLTRLTHRLRAMETARDQAQALLVGWNSSKFVDKSLFPAVPYLPPELLPRIVLPKLGAKGELREALRQLRNCGRVNKAWALKIDQLIDTFPDEERRRAGLQEWNLLLAKSNRPSKFFGDPSVVQKQQYVDVMHFLLGRWKLERRDEGTLKALKHGTCNMGEDMSKSLLQFGSIADAWSWKRFLGDCLWLNAHVKGYWIPHLDRHGKDLLNLRVRTVEPLGQLCQILEKCPKLAELELVGAAGNFLISNKNGRQSLDNLSALRKLTLRDIQPDSIPPSTCARLTSMKLLFEHSRPIQFPELESLRTLAIYGVNESVYFPLSQVSALPVQLQSLTGVEISKGDLPRIPEGLRELRANCDAEALYDVLSLIPGLESLRLSTTLDASHLKQINSIRGKAAEILRDFRICQLGGKRLKLKVILAAIEHFTSLTALSLQRVFFLEDDAKALAGFLKKFSGLRFLELSFCKKAWDTKIFAPVLEVLEEHPGLQEVILTLEHGATGNRTLDPVDRKRLKRLISRNASLQKVKFDPGNLDKFEVTKYAYIKKDD